MTVDYLNGNKGYPRGEHAYFRKKSGISTLEFQNRMIILQLSTAVTAMVQCSHLQKYLTLLLKFSMKGNLFEMKILKDLSRIIIGLVFIFSGVVKAIDPLGSAYKFHDYFQAFHLSFLTNLSLVLAIVLCTAEFISGFSVLTGLRQKQE